MLSVDDSMGRIVSDLDILNEIIARNDFPEFARYVMPHLQFSAFHCAYYRILNEFARGRIKHLMVSIPPQHGKSLGSSQLLPAYLLGVNPDLKIALASYNATMASRFNKRTQRIVASPCYTALFPETRIKSSADRRTMRQRQDDIFTQTSTEFDIVGRDGGLISAGREGALTGNRVDVFILDDLYKDAMEANSPVVRENCWEWYTDVVKTRMHNDSAELIVFTRWHEEDLIGTLLKKQKHSFLTDWTQIDALAPDEWLVVNFEAVKESEPTEVDPRTTGTVLWPERHSLKTLLDKRALDTLRFECMYQGHPNTKEGLLYGNFDTYDLLPPDDDIIARNNYTDTADEGEDKLCSICYVVDRQKNIFITDLLFTDEPMEVTEASAAELLLRNQTRRARIESNNGGRGFARAVQRLTPQVRIEWFHQSMNKEARILTNAPTVKNSIRMPENWQNRWPEFYSNVTSYRRLYKANRWHDAADVLTGIVEMEIVGRGGRILSHN